MRLLWLILLLTFLVMSCSEQSTNVTDDAGAGWLEYYYFFETDDTINPHDTMNVMGVVQIADSYSEIRDWEFGVNLKPYTQHEARSFFHPSIDSAVWLGDIWINDSSLEIGTKGYCFGNDLQGFQTHFSNENTFNRIEKREADSKLGTIDTAVEFHPHVRFIDLSIQDTIDLSEGKTFTFSDGGGTMSLAILITDPDDSDEWGGHTITKVFKGTNAITLTPVDLDVLVAGRGIVEIIKVEPVFLTTSNAKKIALIAKTSHMVCVAFVH